nr:4'-phosphopantetheinyl transferase superfamily protein [Modestobacter versicolor]
MLARLGQAGPAVWVLDLTDPGWDLAAAAGCLTAPELAHAASAVPAVRRRRLLLRAGLRAVVGGILGVPPEAAPIRTDAGRPHVLTGTDRSLGISCSASDGVGLIAAAADLRIGVDVQRHRDDEARQAWDEGWLAAAEQRALARLPVADRLPAVTRSWTQKEAVLKGRGVGLHVAPDTVVVPGTPTGRSGAWWLAPVPVPAGYAATLAVESATPLTDLPVLQLTPGGSR